MILLVVEHSNDKVSKSTLEMTTAARGMGREGPITLLVLGSGVASIAEQAAFFADQVLVADKPELAQYDPEVWASAVAQIAREGEAHTVLIGGSRSGREYSPRVAVKLDAPLVEDAISLTDRDGALVAAHYTFLSRVTETVAADGPVCVVTVKPGSFAAAQPASAAGEQYDAEVELPQPRLRVTGKTAEKSERISLADADLVVSGGRGVDSPEGFKQLVEALADQLGAAVGATRAIVDAGWRPYSEQVGQTGKTVQPKAYIAVGISGAVQHLSGMNKSKFIVAINKDANAPIFKIADYGIVGDVHQIIPAMITELRKFAGQTMLPFAHKIAFLLFAAITVAIGLRLSHVYRRVRAGSKDTDLRFDHFPQRLWYALVTTLTQSRTFRRRPSISFFHSFIFYGFVFYILVNLVDEIEGFIPFTIRSTSLPGLVYNLLADLLSALVLIGVVALVIRRFLLPSGRDFTFNQRTLLHPDVKQGRIRVDSLIVSAFILFHVGSRAVGAGAKLATEGPDRFQPFATLLSHFFTPGNAEAWRIFGYWGALGSVLAFLMYFPFSKHLHIFAAPAKYLVARRASSGVLPTEELNLESENLKAGANKLEDLAWPRLLDAYACIQCNRCQDVCPATATGKALSPSALEINKRMELNSLRPGEASPRPLLSFALSPEAAWACTTCGACMEVCPVQDEPMLDIIDIRRNQVMIQGDFPAQLQTAFRGMERTSNPWGINCDKRMDWAEGLNVKTIEENPQPDVLYWVGCAASYDPQSQKTARAFVQLLDHAGVNFAVLGKKECCTGDSARRAGNELLYQQLAAQNVAILNQAKPALIVATCPHCMNAVGKEYRQLGGNFKVMHHTEYLETLVAQGKIRADAGPATVAYHDPCYLGRHNGVYDAPRNLLNILSSEQVELGRNRENSFCCGAGGAQFWKEEEAGTQKISDNRYREAQQALAGAENKVLAVGCPFCKSMLDSTAVRGQQDAIAVKDVAELLLESVEKKLGKVPPAAPVNPVNLPTPQPTATVAVAENVPEAAAVAPATKAAEPASPPVERKKWQPKAAAAESKPAATDPAPPEPQPVKRKAWTPKAAAAKEEQPRPPEEKLPDA